MILMTIIPIDSYVMITNYDADNDDDKSNTQHKDNKE